MKYDANQSLEQTLEAAIVASWTDLMDGSQTGLIHVEYGFAPTGTVDYLKVWTSITRGHWLLACEYRMSQSTFHGAGVHFDNGYESEGLAHILESVMQHPNFVRASSKHGPPGTAPDLEANGGTKHSCLGSSQRSTRPSWRTAPRADGRLKAPSPLIFQRLPNGGRDGVLFGAGLY